ncbi:hypothetical protein CSB45_01560 [candidate division KSB3 bacterium]|uniref:HTH lacI-type domain-containing protein n=1 Tax=candidate division KSB3 bacterium TaxID=2044937 RepID=A0A2G6EAJ9_9BACT|nr:MAG: hypothetical protein CSB45_01560 [candidate division KSB3 bacterium]PIE30719.1 MAG: hypothetical protein CSA57_01790 [candidate division KSB3 bacterium]
MKDTASKPTIEDVAHACGVSASTVSRVINKSSPVSRVLQKRVEEAIQEIGFQPRRKTPRVRAERIGLMVPNPLNPRFAELINAAQKEADRQGLNLAVFDATENPEFQQHRLHLLKRWPLDGLIVIDTQIPADRLVKFHEQEHIPLVVSRSVEIPELPCIMTDYATVTQQAINYLISLGHKKIACISGLPEWESSKIILTSIKRTLADAGLCFLPELYRCCFPTIEESAQLASNLLDVPREQRPSAIMAFNDLSAIGALHSAKSLGLLVPQDLSISGFGDIMMAAYTTPPLTTISQPSSNIGQLSIRKLSELMNTRLSTTGGFTLLKCSFIVRESTGPCPE